MTFVYDFCSQFFLLASTPKSSTNNKSVNPFSFKYCTITEPIKPAVPVTTIVGCLVIYFEANLFSIAVS